jgi:hypothetical protein
VQSGKRVARLTPKADDNAIEKGTLQSGQGDEGLQSSKVMKVCRAAR